METPLASLYGNPEGEYYVPSPRVEVVVQTNRLGLGYRNFEEQMQLRVNKQIEVEVWGIDLSKDGDLMGGENKIKRELSF